MVWRSPADELCDPAEDRLSFGDVTVLTMLAVSSLVIAALLLLGAACAEHRIAAVLNQL